MQQPAPLFDQLVGAGNRHRRPAGISCPQMGAYDFRYSVLYLGPSSLAFLLRCSRSCSVRLGGGEVRASTGSPIVMKNSSCPGGVHMQSIRAAPPEIFLKKCGAFAGTLIVEPARMIDFWPRTVNSSSPSSNVNISSKSCRCGGGPLPGGTSISIRQ